MLNYLKELLTLSKLFKFKRIFGVFFSTFVVVQFSMSDSLSPLVDSLYIISHQVPFVKWFFKSFLFSFFRTSELFAFLCRLSLTARLLYHIILSLVNSFFAVFCPFLSLCRRLHSTASFYPSVYQICTDALFCFTPCSYYSHFSSFFLPFLCSVWTPSTTKNAIHKVKQAVSNEHHRTTACSLYAEPPHLIVLNFWTW